MYAKDNLSQVMDETKTRASAANTVPTPGHPAGTRSRAVAVVLAFLLGGLGVHKFYLGQTGSGILYLLFFWTLIPSVIAFVEALSMLFMTDDAFAQRYG